MGHLRYFQPITHCVRRVGILTILTLSTTSAGILHHVFPVTLDGKFQKILASKSGVEMARRKGRNQHPSEMVAESATAWDYCENAEVARIYKVVYLDHFDLTFLYRVQVHYIKCKLAYNTAIRPKGAVTGVVEMAKRSVTELLRFVRFRSHAAE